MTRQTSHDKDVNVQPDKVDAFGERVEVAIERAGGTTKMARMAGVSTSVLSKWRRGESDPSRSRLVKMARAASVSIEWLATGEGSLDHVAGVQPQRAAGPQEMDLELLENVARAAFQELERRDINLAPDGLARLVRVLYRHFASKGDQPDHDTVSNIIDLAAYR
ncbi:helix-turn-helix domain-containing protein [Marinobacter halodurans]|nr:helix-turn-helix transcriptional regulator [Marinobacter halodurans]